MRYSILGPLTVRDDNGAAVAIGGARLRRLLVLLLLDPGRTVSTARLIDGIWNDDAPSGAGNALQALVSRLRRTLGDGDPLHGDISGYRLDVARPRVDLCVFEDLTASGRRQHADGATRDAARTFGDALDLWRGSPLADLAETGAANDVAVRLAELRRAVAEERLECLLDAGDHHAALPDIEALVAGEPLRERPVELLMRALDVSGRQADALAVYDRLRRGLADELGIDPSAHIQQLHLRLLRGELQPASPPQHADHARARPAMRLPRALTSFVARDKEVSTAVDMLGGQRLVTLIGPGGAGKTRLAIETATAFADSAPGLVADGVWFVDLASIGAGTEIPHAVLATFGLRERSQVVMQAGPTAPVVDPVDRIVEALAPKALLLVLDNCEHLVADAAGLVEGLLAACPTLRILVTSREPLAVAGERLLAVPSLELPPEDAPVEEVTRYPAVRLFAERVAACSPGFTVDAGNAEHVVRICRELDGMPLALELAAARVRAMPLAQLRSRLSDRFRLLTSGSRSALPRHQTLQAVVDWSWELLDEPEQSLMRRFSVFSGGAPLDAVERVCGDDSGPEIGGRDIWSVLFALVDKSLVVAEPVRDDATPRYRMLETVRAYAAQRLTESGEEERIRGAHARHILGLWSEADPKLRTSEQLTWLSRLRAEHDNLVAAQRWAIDSGDVELALDLYHAAVWYHQMADSWSDLRRRAQEIRSLVGEDPPEGREVGFAECVFETVTLTEFGGDEPEAEIERIQRLLDRAGILPERHETLIFLPVFQGMIGADREDVLRRLEVTVAEGDPWLSATARAMAGMVATHGGMAAWARDQMARALEAFRALGDRWGIVHSIMLSVDLIGLSDPDLEADLLDEGIGLAQEIGLTGLEAGLRCRRVFALASVGQVGAARDELARVNTNGVDPELLFMLRIAEAEVEWWAGDTARAATILADVQRRLRDTVSIVRGYIEPICVMRLARVTEDPARKWAYAEQSWDSLVPALDATQTALVIELFAELAHGDEPEHAAVLLGYAEAVRGLPNEAEHDVARVRDSVRGRIGEDRFAAAYQRGAATPRERVSLDMDGWVRGRVRDAAAGPGPRAQERRR